MKRYGYRICGLFLALVTALLSFAVLAPAASADGADRASHAEMVEKTKARTLYGAQGNMQYRMYRSPSYNKEDDTKPALIILYFHDSGRGGDDNLSQLADNGALSVLLSDSTEEKYKNYNYIVLAPQCPTGERWVNGADPASYSYDPEGETQAMSLAHSLVGEMGATEIVFTDRVVVIGEGDGATAAYDYVCRYPNSVSRFLTVGGVADGLQLYSVFDVFNITGIAYVPKGDAPVAAAHSAVVDVLESKGGAEKLQTNYVDGGLDAAVAAALAATEPTLGDWVISDQYGAIRYLVKSSHKGVGGSITASVHAPHGGDATFKITLKKNNHIKSLLIDGVETELTALTPMDGNDMVYTYTFKNVCEQGHTISVVFEADATAENAFDSAISKVIKVCTVIAVLLVLAAVAVYFADRFMGAKPGKKQAL